LAVVLEVLLILAGADLVVTGALGHCPQSFWWQQGCSVAASYFACWHLGSGKERSQRVSRDLAGTRPAKLGIA
ncbi:MAG TPA: hypothetical protein VF972_07220, partial [Actinomycetota bacterium]